jgi:predicted amidophosphoribosyltransferase
MEERLSQLDRRCPVCRARIEPSYLVCPVCTTRLKQACPSCDQPLESLWQVCPYCATEIPPGIPAFQDVSTPPRRTTRRTKTSD